MVFFTACFLRYIVNALDTGMGANSIFLFILVCGGVFFGINLYRNYVENVIVPLTDSKIYYSVYLKLYKKAKKVELHCYDNADFYNLYTMAMDDTGKKVTSIIDNCFGVFIGAITVGVIFEDMFLYVI